MLSTPIIAQVVGWIGTIVNTLSFQAKTTIHMILMQALAGLIFGTHYLMLGGVTAGLIQYIFSANIILLSFRTDDWKSWRGWKWVTSALVIVISLTTWDGIRSLIPCVCSIIATITNWSRNGKTIRLWRMLVLCPAWIVYNLMVGSWPGIALELIAMASVAVSFWRYGFAALDA